MKQHVKKQVLYILLMGIILVVLFFLGYQYGSHLGDTEIVTITGETDISMGETKDEILTIDAEYVMESHDLESDDIRTESERLPVEFIGLSRSEVIDYISSHKKSFQEEGEEIQNISMISFSPDMLVLRKDVTKSLEISETVHQYENDVQYHYYMVLEDGYLVVYKKDKTTLFLETGITEDELDEMDREQLVQGIGVKNISELYRYLEGFTS